MLSVSALSLLLGSVIGSYLFANLFGWLIQFFTSWDYDRRLVFGALITIVFGGLFSAFGNGEGGFDARMSIVTQYGLWFVWTQFYGVAAMLGLYFSITTLFRSSA